MKRTFINWNKESNHSNNEKPLRTTTIFRNLFLGCYLLLLTACDPVSRYNRLVNNYPYLVNRQIFDTIHIRDGKVVDTTFFWSEGRDTIFINGIRVERFRDTFKFYYKERNCTTNLHTTEIRPSKETQIVKRGAWLTLREFVCIGLLLSLLIAGLWKRR